MPKVNLQTRNSHAKPVFAFKAATLKEFESGWVLEFKFTHPETGILTMHREKFQRTRAKLGNDKMARILAAKRCKELNRQLEEGWTPYGNQKEKEGTKLVDLMDLYIDIKSRDLRYDSMRTIRSFNNLLKNWLIKTKRDNLLLEDFTQRIAQEYLDFVLLKKRVSNCTYNCYVARMRALWNFFIDERGMDVTNPFAKIRKKQSVQKMRKPIPRSFDAKIIDYCKKYDPVLELICHLIYSSYIRPCEILRCKVGYVHLSQMCISLPGFITKNKKPRVAYLTQRSVEIMLDHGIINADLDCNLIGKGRGNASRLLIGQGRQIRTNELDRNWQALRKKLDLPKEYQLYSWRDTGISDLSAIGVSDDQIIKITGHLDKEMVEIYRAPEINQAITKLISKLGQEIGDRMEKVDDAALLRKILEKGV